jgi:hypothetical protein
MATTIKTHSHAAMRQHQSHDLAERRPKARSLQRPFTSVQGSVRRLAQWDLIRSSPTSSPHERGARSQGVDCRSRLEALSRFTEASASGASLKTYFGSRSVTRVARS